MVKNRKVVPRWQRQNGELGLSPTLPVVILLALLWAMLQLNWKNHSTMVKIQYPRIQNGLVTLAKTDSVITYAFYLGKFKKSCCFCRPHRLQLGKFYATYSDIPVFLENMRNLNPKNGEKTEIATLHIDSKAPMEQVKWITEQLRYEQIDYLLSISPNNSAITVYPMVGYLVT